MNKLATIAILAGALAAPAANAAMQVTVNGGSFQFGSGGEFTGTPLGGLQVGPYSAATLQGYAPGTFPTFCLERSETLSFGSTYNVAVSQAAKLGGGGSVGGQDPISKGTAFLITEFAMGTLAGYDFGNSGVNYNTGTNGRLGAAGLLQEAIWYLEDEQNALSLVQGGGAGTNPFVTIAISQFGGTLAGAKADAGGATGARVLNLTNSLGERRQDLLVVVPEPGTYIAGALLGLPFLAGAVRRMRRNRAA